MRVALVADWLTEYAGSERVLEAFAELWPTAPIFTTVYDEKKLPQFKGRVWPSFLDRLPFVRSHHRLALPLMLHAVEAMNLDDFDVVISSSHSVAKGVITQPETLHLSYCHTPMRYAWDDYHDYFRRFSLPWPLKSIGFALMDYIRIWDRMAADRVDAFVANSAYVRKRVKKYYRREAEVIHPPVRLNDFAVRTPRDYFLVLGRLVPYKRVDAAVAAFNRLGLPLKVAGTGPELSRLKKAAKPNIEFLEQVTEEEKHRLLSECRALIFPQEEDFGITPLEAMASGRPVIAFRAGGALETIREGETGAFFDTQTAPSLEQAVRNFDEAAFDSSVVRRHAAQFDVSFFKERIARTVAKEYESFKKSRSWV